MLVCICGHICMYASTHSHIHTHACTHPHTPVQRLIIKIIGHCYETGHVSICTTTLPTSGRQQPVMLLLQLIVSCLQPHILLPQQVKVLFNLSHFTCTTNKPLQLKCLYQWQRLYFKLNGHENKQHFFIFGVKNTNAHTDTLTVQRHCFNGRSFH